jgi:hypothetical protein
VLLVVRVAHVGRSDRVRLCCILHGMKCDAVRLKYGRLRYRDFRVAFKNKELKERE